MMSGLIFVQHFENFEPLLNKWAFKVFKAALTNVSVLIMYQTTV